MDVRFAHIGGILIVLTIANFILMMANEINAYKTATTIVFLASYILSRLQDLLLTLLPIIAVGLFGKRCCCFCCCDPCQPPLDD